MKTAYRDFRAQHPVFHPSDGALRTSGREARTRAPGDGQGPAANPTIASKRGPTHADHPHLPQVKVAHIKTPHDTPRTYWRSPTTPNKCPAHDGPVTPTHPLHRGPYRTSLHATTPTHNPSATAGLRVGGPVDPPHRHKPHSGVEPGPRTAMAIHYTHLAPPQQPSGSPSATACMNRAERANTNIPTIHSTTRASRPNT